MELRITIFTITTISLINIHHEIGIVRSFRGLDAGLAVVDVLTNSSLPVGNDSLSGNLIAANIRIAKPIRNIAAPRTCPIVRNLSLGKHMYDSTRVNPFLTVDVIADVMAPNLFVNAAVLFIPKKPTAENNANINNIDIDPTSLR
jgi:hypothetical protein